MQKVYIVQVQGWGDDEDAMYNVAAFSTRARADAHMAELIQQSRDDDMGDIVTDIEVITVDA